MIVSFPYGKTHLNYDFSGERFRGTLVSGLHDYAPTEQGVALIKSAMAAPIGSPRLAELAKGKKRIVIIGKRGLQILRLIQIVIKKVL